MADSVVGLIVGAHEVRGVEVRRPLRGAPIVTAVAAEAYRVDDGSGENLNDESPVEHGEIVDPAAVTAALERLWASGAFSTRSVTVGLDGRLALVRRTELPLLDRNALRQAASLDIEDLLSYPASEAVFDVAEVGRRTEGEVTWVDTLVVAVHEETLEEIRSVCRAARLKVRDIRLRPAGLLAGAGALGHVCSSGMSAVVHVEDDATDVTIGDQDGLLFSRTLTAGVGRPSTSMAAELEAHIQALSGYQEPAGAASRRHDEDTAAGVSTVVEAVRRTLRYHHDELDDRPVSTLWLTGPQATAAGLRDALAQALVHDGVEPSIEFVDAPEHWPVVDGVASRWAGFEPALGVVSASDGRHVDLVPEGVREAGHRRRRRAIGAAVGLLLGTVAIGDGLSRWEDVRAAREIAAAEEAGTLAIANQLAEYEPLRNEADDLGAFATTVDAVLVERLDMVGVVREIASSMPTDSYLLSLQVRRTEPGETSVGYGGTDNVAVFSTSGVTEDLGGIADWLDDVDDAAPLDGLWLSQSAYGPLGASETEGTLFVIEGVVTSQARIGTEEGR